MSAHLPVYTWKRLAEMTYTFADAGDRKISFTRSDIHDEQDREDDDDDDEEEDNINGNENSNSKPYWERRARLREREDTEKKEEPLPASCLSMEKSSEVVEKMGFCFQSEDESANLWKAAIERVDLRTNVKHAESLETKIQSKRFFGLEIEKRKYWHKRHSLFSMYDDGIQLDEESWYSVTPELLARHIALRMKCSTVIDGFCGAGGNTIQFAMVCDKVIAVDIDPVKIHMARHNAKIYGVEHKIQFVNKDFMDFVPDLRSRADAVFLSPPWGGPAYRNKDRFSLKEVTPDMDDIMAKARSLSSNVAVYLPRNTVVTELVKYSEEGHFEVEQNLLDGRVKTLTVYYGNLANTRTDPVSYLPACSGHKRNGSLNRRAKGAMSLMKRSDSDENLRPFYTGDSEPQDLPYYEGFRAPTRQAKEARSQPVQCGQTVDTVEEETTPPASPKGCDYDCDDEPQDPAFEACGEPITGLEWRRALHDQGTATPSTSSSGSSSSSSGGSSSGSSSGSNSGSNSSGSNSDDDERPSTPPARHGRKCLATQVGRSAVVYRLAKYVQTTCSDEEMQETPRQTRQSCRVEFRELFGQGLRTPRQRSGQAAACAPACLNVSVEEKLSAPPMKYKNFVSYDNKNCKSSKGACKREHERDHCQSQYDELIQKIRHSRALNVAAPLLPERA